MVDKMLDYFPFISDFQRKINKSSKRKNNNRISKPCIKQKCLVLENNVATLLRNDSK